MKHLYTIIIATISALSLSATSGINAYLIEGEAFQFKGKWVVEKSSECLGTGMLRVFNGGETGEEYDALTAIDIKEAGSYHVWTRSRDYENSTYPRSYTLTIGDSAMKPSGIHGMPSFYWEHVGTVELQKKPVLLRLSDTGRYYGRCDAILLIKDSDLNPNTMSNAEIALWRRNPIKLEYTTTSASSLDSPRNIVSGYTTLGSISNDHLRISYVRLPENEGIVCKTDFYADGTWRRYNNTAEDNRIAIIATDRTLTVNHNSFFPSWNLCTASRNIDFEGKKYPVTIDGDNTNPYFTGTLTEAKAIDVKKESANCLKVTYDCGDTGTLTGYWTINGDNAHATVHFVFTPTKTGSYTLALHSAKGIDSNKIAGGLMPPMFSGKRLPDSPVLMFSSMMSQCMSAVEMSTSRGSVTSFVAADIDSFSQQWGSCDYSPTGFSLMNSNGEFQPTAFSPLPGMPDSRLKAGESIDIKFITGIRDGNWNETLEYISDHIFKVNDYRKPSGCSVTKTLENIINLIKDDDYSGWNPLMKGFWDIECDGNIEPTVVHSAPLALLGAATLTHDEKLYEKRALPAIEFVLSRNGYRFKGNIPYRFDPYSSQFPTTLYEGIDLLTGRLNPWLTTIALPEGEIRSQNGYFCTLHKCRQFLSAFRMTGDEKYLDKALIQADILANEILSDQLPPMTQNSFYNSQMYVDWTPLLDIYKETGDQRYLDAAMHGASYTIAGVKTWPKVTDGELTVNKGGIYDGITTIWWKGNELFRLGFPRQAGDSPEHEIEGWKVSSVGLGMEQPATYFTRTSGKNIRPIYMNTWAPRLMELSSMTEHPIYNTYGRNALIGRGMNYPGYYATGFTDINLSEDFPYKGPDVSSIYYHHIPAYLAMMQDYLITGILSNSNTDAHFEPARQEGFVWFNNNIYGAEQGLINNNPATLYMPDKAVSTDNIAINTLTARSERLFHIMLKNEDNRDNTVTITVSEEIARRLVYESDRTTTVTVPAGAVKIISLEADFTDFTAIAPLYNGISTADSGTDAGLLYLFRIRSPFGWDSLYGYADCLAVNDLTIIAECNSETVHVTSWPYEWSFKHIEPGNSSTVKITILKNGKILKNIELSVDEDDLSGIPTIHKDHTPDIKGIYNIYGQHIDHITQPGFYIVNGMKVFHK